MKKTASTFKFESLIYLSGEIINKGFAFLILPLIIRLITREEFGIYSLVITIWPILVIIFGKSFGAYVIRGYYSWDDNSRKQNLSTIFLFNGLIILVLGMFFHLLGPVLSSQFKNISYYPYLQFAVLIAILKVINNNFLSVLRAERKPVKVFFCSMAYLSASVLFMIFFLWKLDDNLLAILLGIVSGLVVADFMALILIRKYFTLRLNWSVLPVSFAFVLPLIPHALASWILNLSDRVLIERFFSLNELAVYALAYQLAFGLDIILTSLNQAWIPAFYDFMKHNQQKEMGRSIRFYLGVLLILSALLILFSREVVLLLGKKLYSDATLLLPIIVLSVVVHGFYYLYVAVLMHRHKTRYIPIITFVSGLLNLGLNVWLLPVYGYRVAAWTTLASYLSLAWLAWYFSKKFEKLPIPWRKMVPATGLIIALLIGTILISSYNAFLQLFIKSGMFLSYIFILQWLGFMNIVDFVRQLLDRLKLRGNE